MRFVLFYHSFTSCWNHGNAHFLRGVARALVDRGHQVIIYEPVNAWSRLNALQEARGPCVLRTCSRLVPGVEIRSYELHELDLDQAVDHADVVIVHEWNDPILLRRLGERRKRDGRFLLLFHDTHHRAVSGPRDIERLELEACDLVLVFGEVLRQRYFVNGWSQRVATWHEAADAALFQPHPEIEHDVDLTWIGNWGDGERDEELQEFLIEPVWRLQLRARLYGVRYPGDVIARLRSHGIAYDGWLPNHEVPAAFAAARCTVHIPRRPYVAALPGIPTIRMFEALACGIPLISAPWRDTEGLFPDGCYLTARNGTEMKRAMRMVMHDADLVHAMTRAGLDAIAARHTCAHRADELLAMISGAASDKSPRKPGAVSREPMVVI